MESIAGTLGLNGGEFLWHLVNFLVLLVLLYVILFKPVTRMLDQRARRVRESMAHAEQARLAAAQAEQDRQVLLAETRHEAEQIRLRAEETARRIAVDLEAKAKEDAERILARAQAEIASSKQQMMAEVRANVADIVTSAVDKVTRGALDGQSQRTLVQQFLVESGNGSALR